MTPTTQNATGKTAAAEAVAVLDRFRTALRAGETAAVESLLFSEQRVPSETDLLSELTAEAGLPTAVAQLRRFWGAASEERYAVRAIAGSEVEVYERITAPSLGEPLRSVTLLRREPSGGWRVVVTSDAPDDRPRMFVYGPATGAALDDVEFSKRCTGPDGQFAELFMDGQEGVLSHPEEDWVGAFRGPVENQAQLTLPSLPDGFYELAVEPDQKAGERVRQLSWLSRVALAAADVISSTHVGVPGAERIIPRETLRHLLVRRPSEGGSKGSSSLPIHRLATIWVKLHRLPALSGEGYAVTRGLLHFGLPELEILLEDCEDAVRLDQLVMGAVSAVVSGMLPLEVGLEFQLLGVPCRLEGGRRGVQPGHSYGPYGALRLVPLAK